MISIPYGAIKRAKIGVDLTEFERFQFLMVRLKVVYLDNGTFTDNKFQFLMVRLKV